MKVTVIQNSMLGDAGLLGEYLALRGWSVHSLVTYREIVDTSFESLEADLVVILGSPRGVYEDSEAWIRREHEMVRHLLARDIPMIGICFGAQLLAKVLGGNVRPMDQAYHDWLENDVVPSETWRGPWLRWHGDRIYPSDQVEVLASHTGVTQAFRHARSIGVQFHPEATVDILRGWVATLPEDLREAGRTGPLAYYETNEAAIRQRSFALFETMLDDLALNRAPARRAAGG
jgi:GMP synthase-like glutamine amidotransferase